MAAKGILKEREIELGISMEVLIPLLLEKHEHKLYPVAVAVTVYPEPISTLINPNTIRHWLKANGYKRNAKSGKWEKKAQKSSPIT